MDIPHLRQELHSGIGHQRSELSSTILYRNPSVPSHLHRSFSVKLHRPTATAAAAVIPEKTLCSLVK
ncbi:unnamed protein product [Gongylonema pulchrum]|uniref:Ovule protein n=1 Tax=Gongylonema pulchrum TaxID=637853 RepID=A0A183E9L6_9BILA|nr:unnamed protein product [Gongylonema pulchrum]